VERGTHAELLTHRGRYAALWAMQQQAHHDSPRAEASPDVALAALP